jgi:TPR repeat protein
MPIELSEKPQGRPQRPLAFLIGPFRSLATDILLTPLLVVLALLAVSPALIADRLSDTRRRAESGDAQAQYELGFAYWSGQDVPRDHGEALRWYEKAARQGVPYAQFELGQMIELGQGTKADQALAFQWFRSAAERDHPEAAYNLGLSYFEGKGVDRSLSKAKTWLGRAKELGYPNAEQALSQLDRVDDLRGEAERGEAEAAFELALAYGGDYWRVWPWDDVFEFQWSLRAASLGHVAAQYHVGYLYHQGEGTDRDLAEAFRWFTLSAEQGFGPAMLALGRLHDSGALAPEDPARAAWWYARAAEAGAVPALYFLALSHIDGRGVEKSEKEVERLLKEASDQGHEESSRLLTMYRVASSASVTIPGVMEAARRGFGEEAYKLALLYRFGFWELPQDRGLFLHWLETAAAQGHDKALYELGLIYENGDGVEPDEYKAWRYLVRAALRGHKASDRAVAQRAPAEGVRAMFNPGRPTPYADAVTEIKREAARGDPQALYYQARLHDPDNHVDAESKK